MATTTEEVKTPEYDQNTINNSTETNINTIISNKEEIKKDSILVETENEKRQKRAARFSDPNKSSPTKKQKTEETANQEPTSIDEEEQKKLKKEMKDLMLMTLLN